MSHVFHDAVLILSLYIINKQFVDFKKKIRRAYIFIWNIDILKLFVIFNKTR